ncbi:hypothetical protein LTR56_000987 [Elasticomyces elasticus]|nr:hypothetical protein LTR22_013203 [Elasticomyces elasticus]KAK3660061.1 hypothetical protein LTR56_000987 [Elasticomyces elasticus]KAK4911062.1 hypothetical protein LTR49_020325 [Elasticomyces elasticus]KAK5750532.1 hypothetical protein LTS12_019408 [Elasticomyces elasticus]
MLTRGRMSSGPQLSSQIYGKDVQQSPLLRLPAELREAILKYVLCGRVLHIGRKGQFPHGKAYIYECKAVDNDPDLLDHLRLSNSSSSAARTTPYFARHACCETAHQLHRSRNHLEVLQICQLIHREAGLLALSENTFLVSDTYPHAALICFLRTLTQNQAEAIRSIVMLSCRAMGGPQEPAELGYVAGRLTGLRQLTYAIELSDYETIHHFIHDIWRERELLAAEALVFEKCALKEVRVSVALCCPRDMLVSRLGIGTVDVAGLEAVARGWEVDLVKRLKSREEAAAV